VRSALLGIVFTLLVSGCDVISEVAGFKPAVVEVGGALADSCVTLSVLSQGNAVGSWEKCSSPYKFDVDLPDANYTLLAQAKRNGIIYQEKQQEALLRKGGRNTLSLSRKRVSVEITAAWMDGTKSGVAEAWMLPAEVAGATAYNETPPAGLEERVLVAREVASQGKATLSVPTGRDVAFRLVQEQTQGIARVNQLTENIRLVVP